LSQPPAAPRISPRSPRIDPRALPSLRSYLAGNFGLTFANGVQNVILGWLVAHALHESGASMGTVMAALMLPNVALSLFGGFFADRFDPRRLLPGLHLLGVLCVIALATAVAGGRLSYRGVLAYALAMGALGAFIAPARDGLMARVAGGALPRVVPLTMSATYLGQLLGALAAGLTERVGPQSELALQATMLGVASVCFALVRPPALHAGRVETRNPLREIGAAWRETLASPRLRSGLAMMLVMGLTLGGTYVPLITMITRDVYGGGSLELSLGLAAMMLGTTSGSVTIALRGGIRRQGRGLLIGLGGAGIALGAFALQPPFAGALTLAYVWGLFGAIGMIMTRTISQENAPATHRARILSLFHLALTGSAPLGSLAIGLAIDAVGAAAATLLPAIGLVVAVAIAGLASELPRIESLAVYRPDSEDQFSSVA
jgi:MFS family permease